MATKPNPKSSYVILDDARVFYDQNADTIHLTIKDKEIPEGIHLSLNPQREDEKRLRKVLANHGLLNQSDLMKEYAVLQELVREFNGNPAYMPRDSQHCIPFGVGAETGMSWNIQKDPHLLVTGDPGSGKSVTLQNIAEYVLAYGESEHMTLLYAKNLCVDENGFDETIRNIKTAKVIVEKRYRNVVESMERNEEYTPTSHVILIVDDIIRLIQRDIEAANMLLQIIRMGSPVGVHVVASSYGSSDGFSGYYDREKHKLALDLNEVFSATFNLRNHHTNNHVSSAEKAFLKNVNTGCGLFIDSSGKTLIQIIPYRTVMEGEGWFPQRRKNSRR